MRFWENGYTSILGPVLDKKALDSPPPKMDFSLPQLGQVILEDDVEVGANTHN